MKQTFFTYQEKFKFGNLHSFTQTFRSISENFDRNILLYRIRKTMFRENYVVVSSNFAYRVAITA